MIADGRVNRLRLKIAAARVLAVLAILGSLPPAAGGASPARRLPQQDTAGAQPAAEVRHLPEDVTQNVEGTFRRLIESSKRILPEIIAAVVVLSVFWGLATIIRLIVHRAARYVREPMIKYLLQQVSYYVVWTVGVIVALDAIGVNPESVITALGLTGVVLGFALQEVLKNLVGGVLILGTRLFEIGDQIVVGDTEGTVEAIDLRATHIRTFDGRLVFVPNGVVSNSRVTNNTAAPLRRESIPIYLSYSEDVARALSIILETSRNVAGIASTPAPSILLRDLAPHYVELEARVWADSSRNDFLEILSRARVAIIDALTAAGIELPLPITAAALGSGGAAP